MPQSMVDPNAMKSFQAWMSKTFKNVGNPAGYTVVKPQSRRYNCIAHAIGLEDVRLTPMTLDDLRRFYSDYGYYPLKASDAPSVLDAEVYAKDSEPGVPLHAHKIERPGARSSKPEEMICSSKMGDDFVIRHPRNLLQCPHKASNRYEYGNVRHRFRKNEAEFAIQQGKLITTRSGRQVKRRDTVLTKSGSIIRKTDAARTASNRITKKPRK